MIKLSYLAVKMSAFWRNIVALFLAGLLLTFYGCNDSKSTYLPGYSGNPGEIILVIDNPHYEESEAVISQTISRYAHGFPQAERVFDVVNIPHESFTKIFKVNRNIVVANIGPDDLRNIDFKKNKWAKGQVVVTISAPNINAFKEILEKNAEQIITVFQNAEIDRLIQRNRKFGLVKEYEKHRYSLVLQKDVQHAVDSNNFQWLRIERERPLGGYQHQISQGVVVYYTDYTDTSQFNPSALLARQDSITKKYIPGPTDNSYMEISQKHIMPNPKEVLFKGNYAIRTTGLWRMHNAHMGGPFVSITTLDEKNARLVTMIGYVFAPQFNKREFLRETEAIMRSIEFL